MAIPEKQNAKVEVAGGENLQYGNNVVNIQVIAENGYMIKQYKINVYRINEEEQKIADEEQQLNIQKLNAILEEQNEEEKQENHENELIEIIKENKWGMIITSILIIIILCIVIYRIKIRKKDKNNK